MSVCYTLIVQGVRSILIGGESQRSCSIRDSSIIFARSLQCGKVKREALFDGAVAFRSSRVQANRGYNKGIELKNFVIRGVCNLDSSKDSLLGTHRRLLVIVTSDKRIGQVERVVLW